MKEKTIELPNKGKQVLQIVKEETLELPKTKNHQDESIIAYINKIYKESFNKFIYFQWIAKSVIPIGSSAKLVGQHIFVKAQAQCTIRYTTTACTKTTNEDLD